MKDPAFLFYPNDYIGGTMGMTFEEKGAYIELLMLQFNRGHMTEHMIGQTVGHIWDNIKDKFIQDEKGLWYNNRLEEEKIKRQKYSESRRNNKSGFNQYSKKPKKQLGHMTEHMENENENENEKFNFKKSLLDLGVEKQIVSDWLKVRSKKSATNTETSFKKIKNQIKKSGLTANECIKIAVEKDWKGFEADWIKKEEHKTNGIPEKKYDAIK